MNKIKFYLLHNSCHDVDSALKYLQISSLKSTFDFEWNPNQPDYLITTEQIYNIPKIRKEYNKIYSKAKLTVFFTREAVTPDFNLCDYAIGFDSGLQYNDRFIQLPNPFELYPAFIKNSHNEINSIDKARILLKQKNKFCNFLYSNHMAHPNRDLLFHILSNYKKIDSLGRHLNNVGHSGTGYIGHENDCVNLKSPYKFSIASENASFTGYTSEKILTSLAAHTVPIYFGDPMVVEKINPDCFINCNALRNIEDVIPLVKQVDENDDLWCKMISEDWQTPIQKEHSKKIHDSYHNFFLKIFNEPINELKRIPIGCRPDMYAYQFFHEKVHPVPIIKKIYRRLTKSYLNKAKLLSI